MKYYFILINKKEIRQTTDHELAIRFMDSNGASDLNLLDLNGHYMTKSLNNEYILFDGYDDLEEFITSNNIDSAVLKKRKVLKF